MPTVQSNNNNKKKHGPGGGIAFPDSEGGEIEKDDPERAAVGVLADKEDHNKPGCFRSSGSSMSEWPARRRLRNQAALGRALFESGAGRIPSLRAPSPAGSCRTGWKRPSLVSGRAGGRTISLHSSC
ncbi:hypothetical protein MAPG_11049 [Magnaporthiopsis poae ATCC 64411]|uniref:Uncharacterized protein n=1 Tax=Magnaporthiopsis poae (strain ATCC 64411 / 73-15) TaxID=644358 RepID=A0A0C4EE84_MAGP6|nr:hypothetical protein MAPG_11049 [Magnaporthiopsis poae ATCC 64411]